MRRLIPLKTALAFAFLTQVGQAATDVRTDIYSGRYDFDTETFDSLTFANDVVGWNLFFNSGFAGASTIIANVEAGHIWNGHEVFLRPSGANPVIGQSVTGTGALNEFDFHATMVGHVLGGTGYLPDTSQFTYFGLGMAPFAELWSGAIATAYSSNPENLGGFQTTEEAALSVYRPFFQGIDSSKPDVINSSWGGGDPAATGTLAVTIDALAAQNSGVAFVASAGNSGSAPVSSPGSNFNGITVGSTGGANFLTPSDFSSSGAVDFFNPQTGETLTGARAAVDIAAPGEYLFLAAYLGESGGLGAVNDDDLQTPSPTDLFLLNQNGTSFSAPIVAGGIALLKDVAKTDVFLGMGDNPNAFDTRVLKAAMMAGSKETSGWDNGQAAGIDGVVRTTQSLDLNTGAGLLDLQTSADVYLLSETRDLPGEAGGNISTAGWDFASLEPGKSNFYLFNSVFGDRIELTVALTWFAGRQYDDVSGLGENRWFSNLDLSVWKMDGDNPLQLIAESSSIANNSEFLRLSLFEPGEYGLRVTFDSLIFDLDDDVSSESYALAWNAIAVPEPSAGWLLVAGFCILLARHVARRGEGRREWCPAE